MAHSFLCRDTLAHAPGITQIKAVVGDKIDILIIHGVSNAFNISYYHEILRSGKLRNNLLCLRAKKPGPKDIYPTDAVQQGTFCVYTTT